MKLFFETAAQGSLFLSMLPVGMLLALCIDLCGCISRFKPLWDLLAVLLCFVILGVGVILLNDISLRLYHGLAVLTGYLLYACGIRRMFSGTRRWINTRKKQPKLEGK